MKSKETSKRSLLTIIGPGILVAATGVGAGDLATGALAGGKLGVAVLWAVLVGAAIKFVLNEGLARWQLATGDTLLEGGVKHFGPLVQWVFLGYLLLWSFLVGAALMSACGVTGHAILPLVSAETDKIIYGILHSAIAVALVKLGGYRLFEKVMSCCIAVMFVVVTFTAVVLKPSWSEVLSGVFVPTIPNAGGEGLQWTVALMGGVGGTLTVLCYGYWIREEGRQGVEDIKVCRIDLATGYTMTAVFGLAMVVIGSQVEVQGKGAGLIVDLANALHDQLGAIGPVAKWAFLLGAWGAIFSSLLGVWQSVPYLFADFWGLTRKDRDEDADHVVDVESKPYKLYLLGLATIPAIGLFTSFEKMQKVYAIFGAMFIPMLAVALLVLNGRAKWVGEQHRNSWYTTVLLVVALAFFFIAGWFEIQHKFF